MVLGNLTWSNKGKIPGKLGIDFTRVNVVHVASKRWVRAVVSEMEETRDALSSY